MNITNKIKVDLQKPGSTPIIYAVQTDSNVRNLEIELFNNRKAFRIPKDVQVIIRYRKFDGSGGEYDTLPDDTPAWRIQKNTLHLALVPQVLASPGSVSMTVTLISAGQQLSVFPIRLNVDGIASASIAKPENYFYVTGFLPAPKHAEIGQYLSVSDVSSTGKVTAVEAISIHPGSEGTIDESTVHKIVDTYLAENPPVTEESDPTVPDWAKQPQKPTYTAQEIGAQPAGEYILKTELPDIISDTLAQAQESGEFDGDPGKSAYEYAQESGYTGTEIEFAEKLAEEQAKTFYVDVTPNKEDNTWSSSKGYAEIVAAYNCGLTVVARIYIDDRPHLLPLTVYSKEDGAIAFFINDGSVLYKVTIISIDGIEEVYVTSENIGIQELKNLTLHIGSQTVNYNGNEEKILNVTALKNPNAFIINGQSYDGSEEVNMNVGELVVNVTFDEAGIGTPDRTAQELSAAVESGRGIVCVATFPDEPDVSYRIPMHNFYREGDALNIVCASQFSSVLKLVQILAIEIGSASTVGAIGVSLQNEITINEEMWNGSSSVDFTDTISNMISLKIPSALKNPNALTVNGITYDGSSAVDMTDTINAMVDAKLKPESELVLSDNLFDKSSAITGSNWYHSSSGPSLVASDDGFYAYVPLRGTGTYRTILCWVHHGESYAKRVPILKADKSFLQNITGTLTKIDNSFGYLEFTVTEEMIRNGAAVYAYGGLTSSLDTLMIVKDLEYPSTYIPYGYIEVEVEGDSETGAANILSGKTAVFLGDSICAGTTVGDDSKYYGYGWAGLIGEGNAMTWKNYGRNGGVITPLSSVDTARWVPTQADTAFAEYPNSDYVLFEGGCNDADTMKDDLLGTISSDYATFDPTTFSGAFESLVLKLLTCFPTAKIGYIIPQKMYAVNDHSCAGHIHRRFFDRAIEICEKWGIPYIDLWKCNPLNPQLPTANRFYTDGQHLTLSGYQQITPQIESFMRSL